MRCSLDLPGGIDSRFEVPYRDRGVYAIDLVGHLDISESLGEVWVRERSIPVQSVACMKGDLAAGEVFVGFGGHD